MIDMSHLLNSSGVDSLPDDLKNRVVDAVAGLQLGHPPDWQQNAAASVICDLTQLLTQAQAEAAQSKVEAETLRDRIAMAALTGILASPDSSRGTRREILVEASLAQMESLAVNPRRKAKAKGEK